MLQEQQCFLTSSSNVSVPVTLLNCFTVSKATQYLAMSFPVSACDHFIYMDIATKDKLGKVTKILIKREKESFIKLHIFYAKRAFSVTCGLDVNVFIHGNQVERGQRVEVLQAQL